MINAGKRYAGMTYRGFKPSPFGCHSRESDIQDCVCQSMSLTLA
ncbi:MAG: hypothetical protein ACYDDB_07660 [bacterium]